MQAQIKRFFTHLIANHSIFFFVGIIIIIVIIGTICFHFIEGRDLFSSFYFTTVTMSTIGYGDMAPLTHGGKVMSIIYGFMGAPLFIGLTGLFFQSKFQHLVKTSIHLYHKEIKETEKLAEAANINNKIQDKEIQNLEETIKPSKKKKIGK